WRHETWRTVIVLAPLSVLSCTSFKSEQPRTTDHFQTRAAPASRNAIDSRVQMVSIRTDDGPNAAIRLDRGVAVARLEPAIVPDYFDSSSAAELTLFEAIKLARESNPDLEAATHRTQLADAILQQARAEFYPRLGIAENYAVSNNPSTTFMFVQD